MHDFSGGGVEQMRLALASALVVRGFSVSLVVVRSDGPLRTQVPPGVKVQDLACSRTLFACLKLYRYIQGNQPDFLISSLDHNNVAALCAGLSARATTRVIVCQHNALSQEMAQGLWYRVIPALYWMLQASAAQIVAVSEGVASDLIRTARIKPDRLTVIGNPVIRDGDNWPTRTPQPPHPWLADRTVPVFVFAGRLVAQKDPATLIRAFAIRLKSGPARLIVLGDGPLRRDLDDLVETTKIADFVYFAGYVSDPASWMVFSAALVLTSRYEGFGNVIVEALQCGTPVIATACPYGPAEILGQGTYGDLVPVGDAAAIARAMSHNLRARFKADVLRDRSRQFTASRCADRHLALFDRLGWRKRYAVFGLGLIRDDAAAIAARLLMECPVDRVALLVTPNLNHIRLLSRSAFNAACHSAEIVCPDGWPVALYASLRHVIHIRRVTGCEIFHQLVTQADVVRRRVLVVTESIETNAALGAWLAADARLQGWATVCAPPNLIADRRAQLELLAHISKVSPDILVMTLGAPTSEVFVHTNRPDIPACWAICVGQAARVELGLVTRAPRFLQIIGLEWAWRCTREPRRLGIRYLYDLLWFPVAIIMDWSRPQGLTRKRS
jgi:exopolysaccharide biosynthesis WecB/TagA/CpsF family protein